MDTGIFCTLAYILSSKGLQYYSCTLLIGASLSEPHIDEKDVRESYMVRTSVRHARRLIFNIQDRPRTFLVQLCEQNKHCEHVDDRDEKGTPRGAREKEPAALRNISLRQHNKERRDWAMSRTRRVGDRARRTAQTVQQMY